MQPTGWLNHQKLYQRDCRKKQGHEVMVTRDAGSNQEGFVFSTEGVKHENQMNEHDESRPAPSSMCGPESENPSK